MKPEKLKLIFFIFLLGPFILKAQTKRITHNNQVWFGDFTKASINDKWSLYVDVGLRRTEWLNKWSQVLVRPAVTYAMNTNLNVTLGIAYFDHYSSKYIRPEFRGWQQLLFSENFGRIKIAHRIRVEERFNRSVIDEKLKNDYLYNTRYRYQLSVQIPVNKESIGKKTFYVQLSDEIMINSGREIIYNYFDQNRGAIGIGYKANNLLNISLAYMTDFIEKNQLNTFENNNVIVVNLYHTFNFKKQDVDKERGTGSK